MSKRKKVKSEAISLLLKLIIITSTAFLLFNFVFGVEIVKENNMFPAIHQGDLLFYYRPNKEYKVNDVVVYEFEGITYIGRIVATGSSSVDFTDNGNLLLNNEITITSDFYETYNCDSCSLEYPFEVPENEYFVLSDSGSDNTSDSRLFGSISSEEIKGVTITAVRRRDF